MRKEYHKLVRDAIPELIRRQGKRCEVTVLTEEQYLHALKEKLVEEAREATQTTTHRDLVTELADLFEVLDALMIVYDITTQTIQKEQERRRKERGGFQQRLCLLWSEGEQRSTN